VYSPWCGLLLPLLVLAGIALFYKDEAIKWSAAHAELSELQRRHGEAGARERCRHMFTATQIMGTVGLMTVTSSFCEICRKELSKDDLSKYVPGRRSRIVGNAI
jgi:hypothetical protein